MSSTEPAAPEPGTMLELQVGAVAHGGHCVARHEGRVVFVRHALPGESVVARVTGTGRGGAFLRADAAEVIAGHPGRRQPPCPVAALCGGCDWQHATPETSRALKAAVVRESLRRFGGTDLPDGFTVAEVPGADPAGLGWRTRGMLSVDRSGRAGFRAPRSHRVVPAPGCPQLHPGLDSLGLFGTTWPPGSRVGFVAPATGPPLAFPPGGAPRAPVVEQAAGRAWSVAADGFWQVHPGAADALTDRVLAMLAPKPGERAVDLYAGVGLFGVSLAARGLAVTCVEASRRACALARANARAGPGAAGPAPGTTTVVRADVRRWVGQRHAPRRADLVVLDPPRAGAGAAVVAGVAGLAPRAVAYVACDPVALGRDLAAFAARGYAARRVVALDLFPTTHHVEAVALLERA